MKTLSLLLGSLALLSGCVSPNELNASNQGQNIITQNTSCSTVTKFSKTADPSETFIETSFSEDEERFEDVEDGLPSKYWGTERGVNADGESWGPNTYEGTSVYKKTILSETEYKIEIDQTEDYKELTGEFARTRRKIARFMKINADGTETILRVTVNNVERNESYTKKVTWINDHTKTTETTYRNLDAFSSHEAKAISRVMTCVSEFH